MKILYLDCFAGISGDMFLGALIDLGVSLDELKDQLSGLQITNYNLAAEKTQKNGITGTKFSVILEQTEHRHRHLPDIYNIIENSRLPDNVKRTSIEVFRNLAYAEGKIHGIAPEQVHFHEVGAIDSIVDIVGTVIALDLLHIDHITCSPLPLGTGFVKCSHGIIPLPAPATLELLKGVPTQAIDLEGETVTPTGAALVKTLAAEFGSMPSITIAKVGYGAGNAERKIPNLLRAVLGNIDTDRKSQGLQTDFVNVIEASIDDMNPEFYDYIIQMLFLNGALDVHVNQVIMKKGRPGQVLTCLASEDKIEVLVKILLTETTTLGVRTYLCQRYKLEREFIPVETSYGKITVKLGRNQDSGEILNAAPEWEECKNKALENKVPVKVVYDLAKTECIKLLTKTGKQ